MTNSANSQTFVYDSLGRITSNSRVGIYEYPLPGQPRPHAPVAAGGVGYAYHDDGTLQSGGGRSVVWDQEDRISAVVGTASFRYDAFGERLIKTSTQGTSLYPFGDDYEITKGVTTKYLSVEGLGVIAKRVTGGPNPGLFWLHTDRLGSIQRVTNAQGVLVFGRVYRPYGETLGQAGAHTESRGWIDQRNDSETGLTYLHARYYDPKLGTFLSPDPLNPTRPGVGMNRYSYGFGNPIGGSDRSGLDWVPCPLDGDHAGEDCWAVPVDVPGPDNPGGGAGGGTSDGTRPGGNGCIHATMNGGGQGKCRDNNGRGGNASPVTPPAPPVPPPLPQPAPSPSKKVEVSGKLALFAAIGGYVSGSFGEKGFGACFAPGLGKGGEVEIAFRNELPQSGLFAGGKGSLGVSGVGEIGLETRLSNDGSGEVFLLFSNNYGQQESLAIRDGSRAQAFTYGGEAQLQVHAGVCISVEW